MKKETRLLISDPADAIKAAFGLFECILADPESSDQYNGATLTPVEQIERVSEDGKREREIAFEVRLKRPPGRRKPANPEAERVLLQA